MATSKELRIENLRTLVKEFKTADAVAQRAGTAPMYLSQILTGAKSSTGKPRGVGDTLARRLESGCGKPEGWLDQQHDIAATEVTINIPGATRTKLAEHDDPTFVHVKKVKLRLSAGVTGFHADPEFDGGSTIALDPQWVMRNRYAPQKLIAIHVQGESMEPGLHEDDLVILNTADTKMVDGVVYAFNYEGEPVIKRLSRDAGEWWLTSDNPDQRKFHRKLCRGGECIIIGRVVRKESERI